MENNIKCIFVLVLFCVVHTVHCAKINTPRVLLPWFPNLVVNFTFEIIEGGCYSWTLSRDDIIDLEPLFEDSWGHCSRAARVSVSKSCVPPGSVIILAEEVNSGEILRGDVDVNTVTSLTVMSTTWKLYLEEAPEAFEVVATDDLGNTFSTLEGVSLTWTIENVDKNLDEAVVKLVKWRDTDYESPKGVTELEDKGLKSYSVLLYGQAMGEAKVTVCLDIICASINLQVVASVVLSPAIAIVAPGDTLKYKVVRARAGRLTVQDIIDTVYFLQLVDNEIAVLEDSVSLVRGSKIGTTSVSLISGNTEVATALLTISEPHSIKVTLRPSNLVVRGEVFTIHCAILDKQGRYLTAGNEIIIQLKVVGEAQVDFVPLNVNGTLTDAIAHSVGNFVVNAKLYSIAGKKVSNNVEGQAIGNAIEPLEVVPPEMYIGYTDSTQEIQLHHRGGGEEPVVWSEAESERDRRQFSLSPTGSLTVRAVGEIVVIVQLKNYPHIRATGRVISAAPEYLQVTSSGSGQARVGKPHYIHVSLTGLVPNTGEYLTFHRCNCASFITTVLEGPELKNIVAAPTVTPMEGACCVLQAVWSGRGQAAVSVRWARSQDSCRVRVRSAPRLLWPKHAALLYGHTVPVLGLGEGLLPESQDKRIAELSTRDGPAPIKYPDVQLFTMTCKKKGDTNLRLTSLSDDGDEFIDLEVSCASHVSRIRLEPPESPGNCTGGPKLWLKPGKEVQLKVVLLDAIGRELLDETGHKLQWDLAPYNRGILYKATETLFVETHPEYVPVPVPNKYYQVVVAEEKAIGWSGTLSASIPDASATIQAKVVAPLKCDSTQVHIAWEGEAPITVTEVAGGSGRYTVGAPRGVTADVEGPHLRASLPGPGLYELVVSDLCVPAGEEQYVEVHVEGVTSILASAQRALCVDSCMRPSASIVGPSRRALRTSGPPTWATSGALEVRGDLVCGTREGRGGVTAMYRTVSSKELEIVVFPPLSIIPSRVRLPVGGKLQLQYVGGPPQHLASIKYETADSTKNVDISATGTLMGLSLGAARVKVVARDSSGNEMTVAYADVEVIPITGLGIHSATSNILVNNPCPLWLESSGLSATILWGLQPRVSWTLRDPSRGRLLASHLDDQLERSTVEGVAVRVIPLKPGPIVVDVKVRKLGKASETRTWESSIELLALSDISTSVEGSQNLNSGDRVALALGSQVRLTSLPRGNWKAFNEEGAFELSNSGELKGVKPGHGVVVVMHRDEKNKVYRETVIHVEVSVPHYCTAEANSLTEDSDIRVVLRNEIGRALLAPETVVTSTPHLAVKSRGSMGSELVLAGIDSTGTFMSFQATSGGVTLKDEIWVTGSDAGNRLMACAGWAVCVEHVGWRTPPGVVSAAGVLVTLVTLLDVPTHTTHTLRMDRPATSLLIHQLPVSHMEFQSGEWPYSMVPLTIEATNLKSTPVLCTEQQKLGLGAVQIELPFKCRTQAPHTAEAVLDIENDQIGCSIVPAYDITESSEIELCAELGSKKTCTKTQLLPNIYTYPTKVSLITQPATFEIHGHPQALKSVKITTSPGLKMEVITRVEGELIVSLTSDVTSCGYGWVNVNSRLTGQETRVEVVRECEQTCGTLLMAIFTLLKPITVPLITLAAMAAGTYYVYKRINQKTRFRPPTDPTSASIFPPTDCTPSPPSPPRARTWARSPYSPDGPVTPIYGDTTILSDGSMSPNNSSRNHSRFL